MWPAEVLNPASIAVLAGWINLTSRNAREVDLLCLCPMPLLTISLLSCICCRFNPLG